MNVTTGGKLREQKSVWEFVAALKQCRELERGKRLHRGVLAANFHTNKYVAAVLITMYSRCHRMAFARKVFEGLIERDVVLWTSLVLGYVDNGESRVALDLFTCMDCEPSSVTYIVVIKALGRLAKEEGMESEFCLEKVIVIHKRVKEHGFESDVALANTLLDVYSKLSSISYAKELFDGMKHRTVVTWNSLLLGYVENGQSAQALALFSSMDCEPSSVTYIALLKACGSLACLKESEKELCLQKGMVLHKQVEDRGLHTDMAVATTLLDMYTKSGSMELARNVFDAMTKKDIVSWNSLIMGYVENGESAVALSLFGKTDCEPDCFTYTAVLKACGVLASERVSEKEVYLAQGVAFHEQVKQRGFSTDIIVSTALLDMYCKCGCMKRAKEVFDEMVQRNVVTWTSLISGYVANGNSSTAMEMFTKMDCEPGPVTYVAALKACESLAALSTGQEIHARACKAGLEQDQVVATALMDFYIQCGRLKKGEELFNCMHSPEVISWNALMSGYSSLGDFTRVYILAKEMRELGIRLSTMSLTAILTACSHTGHVDEAKHFFKAGILEHGISLTIDHYNCMVDALSRANRLPEALDLIRSMPFKANVVTWKTLLAACKKWKNLEVGQAAFEQLVASDMSQASAYVLMSGIHGSGNVGTLLEEEE